MAESASITLEDSKIVEVLADDFEAGERQAGESYCSVVNTNDNNMKLIAKTVLNLIRKFRKTNAPEMKEPLFCSFLIESIVTPFLCLDEDCLTLLGNTDESPVKSSQFMSSLKPSDNKHPGFIKLCNLMKDELDRIVVVKEVVYGLFVEGFKCRLFAMDNEYHKSYRSSMLGQFYSGRAVCTISPHLYLASTDLAN
ncbi:hypothetical protein MUCCIDRAFT_191309 [Mucor lusitanicus CBS 277.49]|uniref:Uncharacterized protein n=1 Tax=Mucor lusitanicus CBS 277.49 TaxID=747725 RepID=A0A168H061_MUCCL|nr:hypothetical protein MUCCIDRAFT_191309 [Mucor lusitanicus CBS 277.49]